MKKPKPQSAPTDGVKLRMKCETVVDGHRICAGDEVITNAHDAEHLIRIRKAERVNESQSES